MPNIIQSFSVGASMHEGKFAAVILKFKLSNGDMLLSAWNIENCMILINTVTKHIEYLTKNEIAFDGDTVADKMEQEAPELSQQEVEMATEKSGVANVSGHMDATGNMTLSVYLDEKVDIVIPPDYAEWVYGYVANTVEEFDGAGNQKTPEDAIH